MQDTVDRLTLFNLVATVDAIVEQIVDIEHSGFYLYDPNLHRLVLHSAKGFTEEERLAAEETAMNRHPGKVFRSQQVLLTQDVQAKPKGTTSSPRSF